MTPHKKMKARVMYCNLFIGEQERFDNFVSKFMSYDAQAEITDDTMMRDDLFDKVTKPLRDGIRSSLPFYPTVTGLRQQLSLLFWELEAEKTRSPRNTTSST